MSDLRERLAEVARLRREVAAHAEKLRIEQAVLDDMPQAQIVAAMREMQKGMVGALAEAETLAKQEALAEYDETQDKRPLPGVEIKVFKVVEYEELAATMWCQSNAPTMLKLDAKRFERFVKEDILNIPAHVAKVVEEPRAQLASDLSEYEEGIK